MKLRSVKVTDSGDAIPSEDFNNNNNNNSVKDKAYLKKARAVRVNSKKIFSKDGSGKGKNSSCNFRTGSGFEENVHHVILPSTGCQSEDGLSKHNIGYQYHNRLGLSTGYGTQG